MIQFFFRVKIKNNSLKKSGIFLIDFAQHDLYKAKSYRFVMEPVVTVVRPQWWSFANVSQQGVNFSKKNQ